MTSSEGYRHAPLIFRRNFSICVMLIIAPGISLSMIIDLTNGRLESEKPWESWE